MSSLQKPTRFEKWVEFFEEGLVPGEAQELFGCELWLIDGLRTGAARHVDDGPAWSPSRYVRLVTLGSEAELSRWVHDHMKKEQIAEYDAAVFAYKSTRAELKDAMRELAATMFDPSLLKKRQP